MRRVSCKSCFARYPYKKDICLKSGVDYVSKKVVNKRQVSSITGAVFQFCEIQNKDGDCRHYKAYPHIALWNGIKNFFEKNTDKEVWKDRGQSIKKFFTKRY